jgi:hypothetical protein
MIRNFKALGLALVAAFALSAVVASAASAQQGTLTVEKGVGGLAATGIATEKNPNKLKAFGAAVECPGSTLTVHKAGSTTELVPNGATEFTIRPHYSHTSCKFTVTNWPATVDTNECEFRAKLGETTGGVAGTYGVTIDVECPVGKEITVTAFTTEADRTAATTQACILHVKSQAGLLGAHATDEGDGHIRVHGTVKGIHVEKTSTGHSPLLCASATTAAGEFDVDVTIQGTSGGTAGTKRSLSLTHP